MKWTLAINPYGSVVGSWAPGVEIVEVMPVSEHDALRDAARLVVDAEYRRQEWGPEATFGRAIQGLREWLDSGVDRSEDRRP